MKKIKAIISHPLISGSTVIVIGTNIGNIFNLFFNFFMLRNLSTSEYGTLISLVSLITLFALIADSFTPAIVNFSAQYIARKQLGTLKNLFKNFSLITASIGIIIFIVFSLLSKTIGEFLNIEDAQLITIIGFCIFFGFLGVVNRGLLQANLSFRFLSFTTILATFLKLTIGILLVTVGFKIYGAISAFFLSFIIPYLLSFIPLRFIFVEKINKSKLPMRKIIFFGLPATLSMFGLTSFITVDLLLVKHFFDSTEAGLYAGLGVVSKIIFYFSAPIGAVLFPLVVQKFSRNENYHKDFLLAFLLILFPSSILTIIYFFFPEFVIRFVMKREEYLLGKDLLGYFGIFLSIYSLLFVIVNFYLSIQKTKVFIPIFIFASLQIIMIIFYHRTLLDVIFISLVSISLLLIILLVYYWKVLLKR